MGRDDFLVVPQSCDAKYQNYTYSISVILLIVLSYSFKHQLHKSSNFSGEVSLNAFLFTIIKRRAVIKILYGVIDYSLKTKYASASDFFLRIMRRENEGSHIPLTIIDACDKSFCTALWIVFFCSLM